MWKIGNVKIKSQVVLAPMAGITSLSYREFMKPFGVGYSVTEMISDAGIVHHNQKTIDYLKTSKLDRPVALQLFGSKVETTLKAIDIINKELKIQYDFLDLNFGCPVRKVTSSGAGSSWLKDPKKLEKYVKAIVKHSKKPVTAKIRLGIDNEHINVKEIIDVLTKAGVKAIAVHARTTKELYSGKPHFALLKDFGKHMKVPLIVSGNIFTLDDAINALKITKADAVMVARGGIGNPHLITQIDRYLSKKQKIDNVSLLKNIEYCRKFARMLIQEKGERTAISILRSIAPRFLQGFKDAKKYRIMLSQNIDVFSDLDKILKSVEDSI
ncbi:MAG: tRNA-dihydrouridine synthase family protein [Bacilli bacterium]|nr:tRNA-dihydrouridine synthase family protein [Bacilli bacterium]